MGWANEHEVEDKRSVKGHPNPIGARDIERERMVKHQVRDQFTGAHEWQICAIDVQNAAQMMPESEKIGTAQRIAVPGPTTSRRQHPKPEVPGVAASSAPNHCPDD